MNRELLSEAEVDRLIERYLDGLLDEAERAQLETLLRASPEAARRLAWAARFERLLERGMRRPASTVALPIPPRTHRLPFGHWRQWREHAWGPIAAVAIHALLLAALIRWVIWPSSSRRSEEIEITLEAHPEPTALDRPPDMPRDEAAPALPDSAVVAAQRPHIPEPTPPPRPSTPPLPTLSRATDPVVLFISHPLVARRMGDRRAVVEREMPPALAAQVEQALHDGAGWLATRQSADGRWREAGADEIGLTSLALLALSARGEAVRTGPLAMRFRAAMDSLAAAVPTNHREDLRGMVLLLNALADGQTIARIPRWQMALDQVAARVLAAERPDGGWGAAPDAPDPVLTAWAVVGLRIAAALGVEADRSRMAIARAADALNRSPNPASGLLYYPEPAERSAAELAGLAGTVLALQLVGEGAGARTARGLRALEERWNEPTRRLRDPAGLEAAWLTACAYQQAGGAAWLRFYARCASAVLSGQRSDGAWPASDGRPSVRATSLAILTLETPWRYPPVAEWPALAAAVMSSRLYALR